jgi:hypothetical protein
MAHHCPALLLLEIACNVLQDLQGPTLSTQMHISLHELPANTATRYEVACGMAQHTDIVVAVWYAVL